MPNVAIVTGGNIDCPIASFDIVIGVDRANLYLISENLPISLAIGDFDSVSEGEFKTIQTHSKETIKLKPEKDDTDTEAALKWVFEHYPKAKVKIYGAFGGRLDHSLSNIFLPTNPELLDFCQQISLIDRQNTLTYLLPGHHTISKEPDMTYISFMTEHCHNFSISNAKYNLNEENFFPKKIYSSNEFIADTLTVSFSSGYLIVIQSKDT